ncbi:uncharacterized protein LOC135850047 isoform X1 [Planococcus citri]|uniref:uncharacterized protein LOC135850047 isoform X1 n=1 Tax=Planococcus citri TaxID=170843 RepID=UPI0031F94651
MKVRFFKMCSITTMFSVFVLIFQFTLQLSNAEMSMADKKIAMSSKDIKPPEGMYPMMPMPGGKMSSMDAFIDINPNSQFRKNCASSYHVNSNNEECLRFCGYAKIGMMDSGANLRSDYLRKKIKQLHKVRKINEKAVYNGIMRCASRGAYDICKKSRNNADCFYEYINSDWVDGDLAWALGPNRPGSGGDFDADDLPWPPRPNWRADMKKGEHTKKH